MLQPSQLEDVSVRYADEIAEMSEFFTTAGIAVEKPETLAQVVQRLREDRGFHRDLTSHVWVMLHRRGSAVRYGETLGVVTLAAAGRQLAAGADESVAHELLRFVMEAHDGLNPPAARTTSASPAIAPIVPIVAVQDLVAEESTVLAADVVKTPIAQFSTAPPAEREEKEEVPTFPEVVEKPSVKPLLDTPIRFARVDAEPSADIQRKPFVWASLAAVLILVALAGSWFYRNTSTAPEAVTPAPVIEGNATPTPVPEAPVMKQSVPETPVEQPTRSAMPSKPSAVPKNSHPQRTTTSARHQSVSARQAQVAPPPSRGVSSGSQQQAAAVAPPPVVAAHPAVAAPATSSPAPIVRSAANASKPTTPTTVSSGTLSKQLDRPGLTPEQEAEYDSTGRRYPHLLRRTPLNNGDTLMAKANVPTSFGTPNAPAGSIPAGTVRPTSLGVMSSNVIYSPAAAYPAAASAAHVAGAVKVEAIVDTSGNVAAARVISGPPQLRDAALNAVQQWRYKPYVQGGKPRQFTTQALMEFELQ